MIMRCFGHEITANLFDVVSIKSSAIFCFRFVANLAMPVGFIPSNGARISPSDMVISDTSAFPRMMFLANVIFILASPTKFGMPSHQSAAQGTKFSVFSFLVPSIFQPILPILLRTSIVLWPNSSQITKLAAFFAPQGIPRAGFATICAGVHMLPFPLSTIAHVYIMSFINHNVNPHSPRQVSL